MQYLKPAKIVALRRELVSRIGNLNITPALQWCKDKYQELGGHVDTNTILKLFEEHGMTQFLGKEKEPKLSKNEIYINRIIEETGLTRKEIKKLVDEKQTELKGLISTEGALFIISKEMGLDVKGKMSSVEYLEKKRIKSNKKQTTIDIKKIKKQEVQNMKDFWDRQEDSSDFLPFLKIKTKVTYTLELVDNEAEPKSGVDGYGNNQFIFDVILKDIKPKKALEDVNKDGFPLFLLDKGYAFSVKTPGRSKDRFKELWANNGPVETFTFMRTGKGYQTDYVYKKVK